MIRSTGCQFSHLCAFEGAVCDPVGTKGMKNLGPSKGERGERGERKGGAGIEWGNEDLLRKTRMSQSRFLGDGWTMTD